MSHKVNIEFIRQILYPQTQTQLSILKGSEVANEVIITEEHINKYT